MFRETGPQSSLFDASVYFPGILPEDDWSFIYRKSVLPLIDEEKFRHLYDKSIGRPNESIRTQVSLLIFMGLEKLTWRSVEFQFSRRIDWLIATKTPLGEANIDHTTLFKFYGRLSEDNVCLQLFNDTLDSFRIACGTCLKKQRTDSFFIHGWLQILSRYGLFKETIKKFLQALRKQKPGLYEKISCELSKEYLEKEFDLTEKDKTLAEKKIILMAKDLYKIVKAFENHKQVQHYETFKILYKVFHQQCEVSDVNDTSPDIIIKEKPEKDTICSPHNPHVRYIRKRKQRVTGHKVFATETCSEENKTQFITDISVAKSTHSDSAELANIQDRLTDNGHKPEDHHCDAGFVNGATILESKDKGVKLEGPSSGRSQSFEAYEASDRPLDAGDFDIDFDEKINELHVNKCPNGQKPISEKRSQKTNKLLVHFDSAVCCSCSKAGRCPVKIGKKVATFTVDEPNYMGARRHHKYMNDKEYRKECAPRAGAESMVSELTRAHGLRKSRHREDNKIELQAIFGAIACNIKRFIRHGQQYAYLTATG